MFGLRQNREPIGSSFSDVNTVSRRALPIDALPRIHMIYSLLYVSTDLCNLYFFLKKINIINQYLIRFKAGGSLIAFTVSVSRLLRKSYQTGRRSSRSRSVGVSWPFCWTATAQLMACSRRKPIQTEIV